MKAFHGVQLRGAAGGAETEQDAAYACDDLGNAVRCRYPTPGSANAAKEVVL